MKNPMDRQLEKRLSERAVAIGREGEVAALGKLAWMGVDQSAAVATLAPLARCDPHPQTRHMPSKHSSRRASD